MNGSILFGRSLVRRELLIEFFVRARTDGHVREVARSIGRAPAAVGRELERLQQAGILRSFVRGRNRTYAVDAESPVAGEIRLLIQRTVGIEATLRKALEGLSGIEEASIFGSYASGKLRRSSDIDLLIVGSPPSNSLRKKLRDAERVLRRDVNVVELTADEVRSRRRKRDPLIGDILRGPRIVLVGASGHSRH